MNYELAYAKKFLTIISYFLYKKLNHFYLYLQIDNYQ